MEIDELKSLWREENRRLESKIEMNEKFIRKIQVEKAVVVFDKLMKLFTFGKNAAFVYYIVSVLLACTLIRELAYSIPCLIGGLLMLTSFFYHSRVKKPDYNIPLLELQKSLTSFRVYTASSVKYDIAIVVFWLLTISPVYLKTFLKIAIYDNQKTFALFCFFSLILDSFIVISTLYTYKSWHEKLKQAEALLEEVREFEK